MTSTIKHTINLFIFFVRHSILSIEVFCIFTQMHIKRNYLNLSSTICHKFFYHIRFHKMFDEECANRSYLSLFILRHVHSTEHLISSLVASCIQQSVNQVHGVLLVTRHLLQLLCHLKFHQRQLQEDSYRSYLKKITNEHVNINKINNNAFHNCFINESKFKYPPKRKKNCICIY